MPLSASLRLATSRFQPGKAAFNGSLGLAPLQVRGQMEASRLPVHAFEPYFAEAFNIELLRADASFKGRVVYRQTPAGPKADVAGDVTLEAFKANTLAASEELLAWKMRNVRGLTVALNPAKTMRVHVRETVLNDFFARVIVIPDGRVKLQDLMKPAASASAYTAGDATKKIAEGARPPSANTKKD